MREARETLEAGHRSLGLSARGWDRCLRLARTIADLGGEEQISAGARLRGAAVPRAAAIVSGSKPRACAECLRRAWLIGSLAGHIENAVEDTPGSRRARAARSPQRGPGPRRWQARVRRSTSSAPRRAIRLGCGQRSPAASAWACCRHDELFPGALAELGDQPAVLFGRGDPELLAGLATRSAVTIVGSRRPSSYGRELATELGSRWARRGSPWSVAWRMGIDSHAHRGALESGGLDGRRPRDWG